MPLDQFMLWRFRYLEGILDNIKSWNITECVFNDGKKIKYDMQRELLTIETPKETVNMLFCELTKEKLFSMGFKERFNNRHTSSYNEETTYAFQIKR